MPVVVQSVTRALRILDVLAQHPQGLGVAEIAKQADLNVSTAHHLLNTLFVENYVGRLPNGGYCLGYAVSRLYSAFVLTQQPDGRLLKVLHELVSATQETSYLAGWRDGDVAIQSIMEGTQQLRVGGLRVGYRGHTHARAAGKALLAYLDEARLNQFLAQHPLSRLTPNTICEPDALRAELKQIAAQGYSLDREEFTEGVCCVAAPIFSADGQPQVALSLSAPAWRLKQNMETLVAAVKQAAAEASGILGHRPGVSPNGKQGGGA
jgi:DNA-binding IclR family transcriptional regulator